MVSNYEFGKRNNFYISCLIIEKNLKKSLLYKRIEGFFIISYARGDWRKHRRPLVYDLVLQASIKYYLRVFLRF